jgi:DNA repair exonuclease SbcCD nuclease subunit
LKIAIITDTHWGVRNDNVAFLNNSKQFLDNIFFPTIEKMGIDTVLHLGDLVDRRKYININTARRLRQDFLQPLNDRKLKVLMVAGNHDTYFKNTNEVNALREIVSSYQYIDILDKAPQVVTFDNLPILLIPWICDENRRESIERIKGCDAQVAAGHLEIQGFEMYRGSIVSHGDDRSTFDRFDMVLSGHYHHRSSDGSIFYLGSHGEFTWSDYDDPRGFHILDTETRKLTFIENPYKMFKKVWYNDTSEEFLNTEIDYAQYKNCMLKVIVQEKTNLLWFDKFIENIESETPIDIQVVEDHLNLNLEEDSDIVNEAESTIDIFKKYINGFDEKTVNKEKLEKKIVELYNEALTIE